MKLLILFLLLTCNFAYSATQKLLKITNNIDNKEACLYLNLDTSSDIENFSITNCQKSKNGGSFVTITPDQTHSGVVVYRKSGHDVVKLSSKNFNTYNGGHIKLSYLYNGMTKSYRYVSFELSRSGDSWEISLNGKEISGLRFFGRRWFGKVVGISGYQGN